MMDMGEYAGGNATNGFGHWLNRVESFYLRALRAGVLIVATGLLLYAGWLAVSGIYQANRSTDSVIEQKAEVRPDELTDAEMPVAPVRGENRANGSQLRVERTYYAQYLGKLYGVFRSRFEPFRQPGDKQLTRDEFDDAFLHTATRIESIGKGELSFAQDKADLTAFLKTITDASSLPATMDRLRKYRSAKKVEVSTVVDRIRQEMRTGWDTSSTACESWYLEPIGCSVSRMVDVPYTETVKEMRLPEGTQSHILIYQAFQNKYFGLLAERRAMAQQRAIAERERILADNAQGWLSLSFSVKVVGGFIVLMFFFLLIAIERHQRKLVA